MTEDLAGAATEACPLCGGRGWRVQADGGAGTATPCDCRSALLRAQLHATSGIPASYRGCTFEGFKTDHYSPAAKSQLERALAESRLYVNNFQNSDGSFATSGLIFVGPTGSGKTHLASALTRELVDRYRRRARFVEFTQLVYQIQSTFGAAASRSMSEVLDPVIEAELLVIDELGAQKPTPWVQNLLYLIINSRYTERRPTLYTTNFRLEPLAGAPRRRKDGSDRSVTEPEEDHSEFRDLDYLGHRLPANLISRLFETTKPILLDAVTDYRREVKSAGLRPRR